MIIEASKAAQDQVKEYFSGKEIMAIRVFFVSGGCAPPYIALALDNAKETDLVFDISGFRYIADKEFLKSATPVFIDHDTTGFRISSNLVLTGTGCSKCKDSGNCG